MSTRFWSGQLRQTFSRFRFSRPTNVSKNPARLQHTETGFEASRPVYSTKRYRLLNPTMIVLGVIPIFTFYLGTWQLQRLKWKVSLIDELTEKLEREPLHLPNKVNIAAIPDFIYRKVILRGRWDDARSMLLGPRVRDGTNGYHLITPLIRTNGSTVLVDRGFVSGDFVKSGKRIPIVEGEVEVRGMLRDSQARNYFTPDNHPEKGEWYWADLNAMAEYVGGENANVQQVLVEEIFEGHAGDANLRVSHGIPIGKAAVVDVRNAHASYVVTWYALSAFTTVMFVRLLLKQRRAFARLPR